MYPLGVEFLARKALLLDACDAALRALSTIPQDDATTQLIEQAQRLRLEVEAWTAPSDEQMAHAEDEALALNVAVQRSSGRWRTLQASREPIDKLHS